MIPYISFAISFTLYILEYSSYIQGGEMTDRFGDFLQNNASLFFGLYVLVCGVTGATSYLFVKKVHTATFSLTSNFIITLALLPIQLLSMIGIVFLYLFGGILVSVFLTLGKFNVWKYLPLAILILLIINAIYSLPTFLHGLFGVLRAFKEKLLSKSQTALLIIFMLDPLLRFIPAMIAMILTRRSAKRIAAVSEILPGESDRLREIIEQYREKS